MQKEKEKEKENEKEKKKKINIRLNNLLYNSDIKFIKNILKYNNY